jgi:hypothetical protein
MDAFRSEGKRKVRGQCESRKYDRRKRETNASSTLNLWKTDLTFQMLLATIMRIDSHFQQSIEAFARQTGSQQSWH